MKNTLITEMAARLGVDAEKVATAVEEKTAGIFRLPPLVSALGEHYFVCENDDDPKWLYDVGSHFKSKRNPIFRSYDRAAWALTKDERRLLVMLVQTSIGAFCIYRAKGYDGHGASFLHRDEDCCGYVVEPFDTWFETRTLVWKATQSGLG